MLCAWLAGAHVSSASGAIKAHRTLLDTQGLIAQVSILLAHQALMGSSAFVTILRARQTFTSKAQHACWGGRIIANRAPLFTRPFRDKELAVLALDAEVISRTLCTVVPTLHAGTAHTFGTVSIEMNRAALAALPVVCEVRVVVADSTFICRFAGHTIGWTGKTNAACWLALVLGIGVVARGAKALASVKVSQVLAICALGTGIPINALAAMRLASLAPTTLPLDPNTIEAVGTICFASHFLCRVKVVRAPRAKVGVDAHCTSMSTLLTLALIILEGASVAETRARTIRL